MLLTYIDETHAGTGVGNYYVVALVFSGSSPCALVRELDAVGAHAASAHQGASADTELHGYELMEGAGPWAALKRMPRARIGIYDDALRVIARHTDSVIIRGIKQPPPAHSPAQIVHPHVAASLLLFESLDRYCEERDDIMVMVADEHAQYAAVRKSLRDARHRARTPRLLNLIDTCHFVASRDSRLVQAADLVAYIYRRQREHAETNPRALEARNRLWGHIAPLLVIEDVPQMHDIP